MLELLFYSLIGGLFSLSFASLLLVFPALTKKILTPLVAFGGGAFLGAVFFDILPEAIESVTEPHPIFIFTATGFILFFILERLFMRYFKHELTTHKHNEHTEPLPFLIIIGDALHNFLDGVVIGISFLSNQSLGLTSALAIAAHEIPQEIGDFSILINSGWSRKKVLFVNILQSLTTVVGAFLAFNLGQQITDFLPNLLGATAGIFLYLSASDIIPELHHKTEHRHVFRVILPLVIGAIVIYFTASLAHGH